MRIAHLIASSRGGGAAQLLQLAAHQVEGGHRVRVLVPDEGELDRPAARASGIELIVLAALNPSALPSLRGALREAAPDVIHLHGARAALLGRLALLGGPRPRTVYAFHGFTAPYRPWPRRVAMWIGERALAPLVDAYVCVCDEERRQVKAFGLPGERLHVIHNGIDPTPYLAGDRPRARAALDIADDAFVALSAGRLDQPRDPELLVQMAHQVRARVPRFRLFIAGQGPLERPARAAAEGLSMGEAVRFLGYRQDVPDLLAAADAFVHVTRGWEGFPLAVLEAMAAGLPVVATRAGGLPELVIPGQTGYLAQRGDLAELVEPLVHLSKKRQFGRKLGEAGRRRVIEHFSLPRMFARYDEIYTTAR